MERYSRKRKKYRQVRRQKNESEEDNRKGKVYEERSVKDRKDKMQSK